VSQLPGIDSKYWAIAFIAVLLILVWVAISLLLMVLGDLAAVDGQYPRAVCFYSWAEKFHWRSARLYTNRGNLRYRLGDLDKAAQDFGRSIQLQAKQAEAYWGRGGILMSQGQNAAALADYDLGLGHRQNSAEAYCSRGIVRQRRGDREGSIQDFERALELQPDFFYPHYYLGGLRAETDRPTALAHVERAIELRPQYPPLYYLQAYLHFADHDAAAVKDSLQLAAGWENNGEGDRYLKDEYGYFYRAWAMEQQEQPAAQQDWQTARELAMRYDNQLLLASLGQPRE
jgi:tetratricopeptide (TPR) repeat protein